VFPLLAAGLWGFAEATLFFVVPDVLLSATALRNPRSALRGCAIATLGAMIGGAVMYHWGATRPEVAVPIVAAVPAVGTAMMENAAAAMHERGVIAPILGPLTATPYKVYAVQAAAAGIPLWLFMVISPIARLPRFLLATLLAAGAARALPRASSRTLFGIWAATWIAIYAFLWRSLL
jgi:membrane protein YqaA with SNARE-associated domain